MGARNTSTPEGKEYKCSSIDETGLWDNREEETDVGQRRGEKGLWGKTVTEDTRGYRNRERRDNYTSISSDAMLQPNAPGKRKSIARTGFLTPVPSKPVKTVLQVALPPPSLP